MPQSAQEPSLKPADDAALPAVGSVRWIICGLLFLATTVNYIDRSIIAYIETPLTTQFHWKPEVDYANLVAVFQLAYAFGYLLGGRVVDRLGVKRGFPLLLSLWSFATAAHGLITYIPADSQWNTDFRLWGLAFSLSESVFFFGLLRVALGLFEGGNFPAAVKTVGEWFPIRERALATGIFNCGSTLGPVFCPLLIPWINKNWGWEATFYITGGLGLFWVVLWLACYDSPERHRWLSQPEREYIQSGRAAPKTAARVPWLGLLHYRAVWAFVIGILMTSPVWWFFLFWLPKFLKPFVGADNYWPVSVVYLISLVGSVGGGWIPARLLRMGMSLNAARKLAMLICALCVLPVSLAPIVSNLWVVVILVGLAAAAHQGWAANLYTLVSDTMPKEAVSSVVGMGGLAAGLTASCSAWVTGKVLAATGSYVALFAGASVVYILALGIIQLLLPQIRMITLQKSPGLETDQAQ